MTGFRADDILTALKNMNLIEAQRKRDGAFVISKEAAMQWAKTHKIDPTALIDSKNVMM